MSQHSSLKTSRAGVKHRTVLKRYERFFALKEKNILQDDSSVFGMPKLKIVRTKIKKEKAVEKPKEEASASSEAKSVSSTSAPKEQVKTAKREEKKK